MASSESEVSTDDDFYDDDEESDEDQNYGQYGCDDDVEYDFHNDDEVSALIHSLLAEVPVASLQAFLTNAPNNQRIRPSMGGVNLTHTMASPPISVYGDFIVSYLTATPFQERTQSTAPFYLSDSVFKQSTASNSAEPTVLFVGNIPLSVTAEQLKSLLEELGCVVKDVQLPASHGESKHAFVHFYSHSVAELVRTTYDAIPDDFVLEGNTLTLSWPKSSTKQPLNARPSQNLDTGNATSTSSYSISDIYYGTLITGAALRNIHKQTSSIVSSDNEFGVIGHSFDRSGFNIPFTLTLDSKKRRIALVGRPMSSINESSSDSVLLSFEWRFSDLKGKKIIPVLIDRTLGERDNYNEVFLLMEVKRPPTILETKKACKQSRGRDIETRQPGNQLIGHANTWLFRLSSEQSHNVTEQLFNVLNQYNLTTGRFSHYPINQLIGTAAAARENLEPMRLLSNEMWVWCNADKVNEFLEVRWPSYPFETKFEIMKLISKHIITVNDLIVDEAAERILKTCSISTVSACTDKIMELAPRWLSGICDDDTANWNEEEQAEATETAEQEQWQNIAHPTFDGRNRGIHVHSATGQSFRVSANGPDVVAARNLPSMADLGTFSRLLAFSLRELKEKHELRTDPNSGLFVTKHELRSANSKPSLIRKIYITPSTITYEGPYREEKCAVMRQYEEQQDQFLRVSFRDEDFRLLHNYNDNMKKMYERMKQILIKGVTICDRKYEFLAFSSSQLREHSCWMFASLNSDVSAESIRSGMGDFRDIRLLAKYSARLGQSFSTSIKGIALEKGQFDWTPDHEQLDEHGRNLCFTDGIGIIAPWMAAKLAKKVRLYNSDWCPSAFQIRCGGYKGMVCVDAANLIPDGDVGVYFRPSMNKFTANNHSIDVVRVVSNLSSAYLNRQIILLLSSLGIPDRTFLSLQKTMLDRSLALTQEPEKARQALRDLNEFGGNGCHAFLIDFLSQLGKHKEPFTQRLLYTFQKFLIKELRTKAKILVPNSWSLFGVVDETEILEYGQCFVQIHNTNRPESERKILTGPVVVTRNPCFHPGDIRRLTAIDVPWLHGLKNVIVFPKKGVRPHPMEMSGGDLDGDTFWVCHDAQLIFSHNEEPFDYQDQDADAQKKPLSKPGSQFPIEDVCDFFGEYIKTDNLGIIANSHLALADRSNLKAKDEKCLKLARMHSTAVDFAKNGVSAPPLTTDLRPQSYPHFMEKKDKPQHISTTILGKLYDDVANLRIDLISRSQEDIERESSFPYQSFYVAGEEEYEADASSQKYEYERELMRIMCQYGIQHEEEIVSGHILKFHSKQYNNQTKLFELRNEIAHAYRGIRDKYLHIFWKEFYESEYSEATNGDLNEADDEDEQSEASRWSAVSKKLTWKNQYELFAYSNRHEVCGAKVKQKASSWLGITYEPWARPIRQAERFNSALNNQENNTYIREYPRLFSFAWLVYPVLLDIYRENHPDSEDEFHVTKRAGRKRRKHRRKRKGKNNGHTATTTQNTNRRN